MAVTSAVRKVLVDLNSRWPGIAKYFVAEPKYWDLEKPKYWVTADHYHPQAALPDLDYTKPPPGVRELDGPVSKEGFHYWTRDRRRTMQKAVTLEIDASSPESVLTGIKAIQAEVLKKSFVKEDSPVFQRVLHIYAQSMRTSGRPGLDHPYNGPTDHLEEGDPEYFWGRYHNEALQDAWIAQEHNRLDELQRSAVPSKP
jgi:hypothetical protein